MRPQKKKKKRERENQIQVYLTNYLFFFLFKKMILQQNDRTIIYMSVYIVPLSAFFSLLTHLKLCYSEQKKNPQREGSQRLSPLSLKLLTTVTRRKACSST